jgi:hypothetical protein
MKILTILKEARSDLMLFHYLEKLKSHTEDEVHFFAPIGLPGDIPTQNSGEVIDHCTEFDLSEYEELSNSIVEATQENTQQFKNKKVFAKMGRKKFMIEHWIRNENYDLVVTHKEIHDHLHVWHNDNLEEKLLHNIDTPLLTLACDHSVDLIQKIGILDAFESLHLSSYQLLDILKSRMQGGELHLLGIEKDASDDMEKVLQRMKMHAEYHQFKPSSYTLIPSDHEVESIQKTINSHQLDLLFMSNKPFSGLHHLLKTDLQTEALNEIKAPLLMH